MSFDVSAVRATYPALGDGYAYLDGAAGTQVPELVITAISDAYRAGIGNVGGAFPASHRADAIVAGCRQAAAGPVGGHPGGGVLGAHKNTPAYPPAPAPAGPGGEGGVGPRAPPPHPGP